MRHLRPSLFAAQADLLQLVLPLSLVPPDHLEDHPLDLSRDLSRFRFAACGGLGFGEPPYLCSIPEGEGHVGLEQRKITHWLKTHNYPIAMQKPLSWMNNLSNVLSARSHLLIVDSAAVGSKGRLWQRSRRLESANEGL